jgi:hypothetical protein
MKPGIHVEVSTAARYCARAGLGSARDCRRWLVNEFNARGRVVISGRSLGGYRDERGTWWVRTQRLVKVLGLNPDEGGALRGFAETRPGPRVAPGTKRLKRGECLTCAGPCGQRALIEMDADVSWDGRPHPDLVADLAHHQVARRAVTVPVKRPRTPSRNA